MHFYSPAAAKQLGINIKSIAQQVAGLRIGDPGPGPDITPRPLTASEASPAAGMLHVAASLIASARARQNYEVKMRQQAFANTYMEARIAEIRERLHPSMTTVRIGTEDFTVPTAQAARITAAMQPKEATGDARVLGDTEVATVNQSLSPARQLKLGIKHTEFEAKAAMRAEAEERAASRAAGSQQKIGSLTAGLGEIENQEKAATASAKSGAMRNVRDWQETVAALERKAGGSKNVSRLKGADADLYAAASSKLAGGAAMISAVSDSAQAANAAKFAPARAKLLKGWGVEVEQPPGQSWVERWDAISDEVK